MSWGEYMAEGVTLLFLGIGAWMDLRSRRLSVCYLAVFGIFGMAGNLLLAYQEPEELLGGILLGCAFLLLGRFTREAIGYGDGLGILVLGILKGFGAAMGIVFSAFILCWFWGIGMLLFRKASVRDSLPLFPFLFAGMLGDGWL